MDFFFFTLMYWPNLIRIFGLFCPWKFMKMTFFLGGKRERFFIHYLFTVVCLCVCWQLKWKWWSWTWWSTDRQTDWSLMILKGTKIRKKNTDQKKWHGDWILKLALKRKEEKFHDNNKINFGFKDFKNFAKISMIRMGNKQNVFFC